MKNGLFKKFIGNLSIAFLAQIVTLLFSIVMQLLVPKVLGESDFAYWQLFIFYSSYVGLAHFGLMDGLYLRLGGKSYEEINKPLIGSQLWLMFGWQVLISSLVLMFALFYQGEDSQRFFIWVTTAGYLIVANFSWFLGYIFQAVNRTKIYSISVIISRVVCILLAFITIVLKVYSWELFIISYVLSQLIACIYCIWYGRDIVFVKLISLGLNFKEAINNIRIGIKLTISNTASQLVLGVGRWVMDFVWGIEVFGRFSFSLSLTNFFLAFISQISMVLFPALRQVDTETQKNVYKSLRTATSILFCGILLLYIPMEKVLLWWLPGYGQSIRYLALLLPICIFDGKMQLLCNTYLKTLRKERALLVINLFACLCSLLLCAFGAFVIIEPIAIVIAMVVSVAVRSCIAEYYLGKAMNVKQDSELFLEIVLAVVFACSAWFCKASIAFCVYFVAYVLFVVVNKNNIKSLIVVLKKMAR